MDIKKTSTNDDPLIQALLSLKGSKVEVLAFGTLYNGTLKRVDLDNGTIFTSDGEDKVILEIERIESLAPLS